MACKECGNNRFFTRYPERSRVCSQCRTIAEKEKSTKKGKHLFDYKNEISENEEK